MNFSLKRKWVPFGFKGSRNCLGSYLFGIGKGRKIFAERALSNFFDCRNQKIKQFIGPYERSYGSGLAWGNFGRIVDKYNMQ